MKNVEVVRLLHSLMSKCGTPVFTEEECKSIADAMTPDELPSLVEGVSCHRDCHKKEDSEYLRRIYDIYGNRTTGGFFMFSRPDRDYPSENSIIMTISDARDYVDRPAVEAVIRLASQQTDS